MKWSIPRITRPGRTPTTEPRGSRGESLPRTDPSGFRRSPVGIPVCGRLVSLREGVGLITGFNTNVRHAGRVFHVQTEDSGRDHPHVISHVYCNGTIVASKKSDYADGLGADDLNAALRRLMERQHSNMLETLQQGGFDAAIADRLGGEPVASPEAARPAAESAPGPVFGDGIVSARPLDTVILEYLVDKSRTRGEAAEAPSARGSRSRE